MGITYSKVTSQFNKYDYTYVSRHKKYLKVNLNDNTLDSPSTTLSNPHLPLSLFDNERALIGYLLSNKEILTKLIEDNLPSPSNSIDLLIDKRILASPTTSTKNLTVHTEIYKQFTSLCTNQYPQYQTKHLLAQAMIEFIDKYSDTTL